MVRALKSEIIGHYSGTVVCADTMLDYQMMSRNVHGFMSLFNADKPVVCKVHGFKEAVRERDEPFGDFGPRTFKG